MVDASRNPAGDHAGGSRERTSLPPRPQQRPSPLPGARTPARRPPRHSSPGGRCRRPAAAIVIVVVQGAAGGTFGDSFRVPGVESQRAADVLKDRFPSQGGASARIVLHTDEGRLDDTDHAAAIDRARQQLDRGTDVADVTAPALSADGRTAYVDVAYTVDKLTGAQLDDAHAAAEVARVDGVQTELTGALALLDQKDPASELIGIAVAVIVLLVAFGSVVAMGLPIVTA